MSLKPRVGQLLIIPGSSDSPSHIPGIYAQPAPVSAERSRDRDVLLLNISISGDAGTGADLLNHLAATLSRTFFARHGSITAALRTAISKTNQALLHYNLENKETRRDAALTCAALRDSELYMAQVGEGLAFIGHSFGLERFPPEPPVTLTPMGRSAGLDVRYYHSWLQPGDLLMIADPRISHLRSQTLVPALVRSDLNLASQRLTEVLQNNRANLLLVAFSETEAAHFPSAGWPDAIPPLPAETKHQGKPTSKPRSKLPLRDPAFASNATEITRPLPSSPIAIERPSQIEQYAEVDDEEDVDYAIPAIEINSRRAASGFLMFFSSIFGGIARFLARIRPASLARSKPTNTQSFRDLTIHTLMVILIPVIVTLIASSVYFRQGEVSRMSQIRREIGIVRDNIDLAQSAGNSTLSDYQTMSILAEEALSIRPENEDAKRWYADAISGLDNAQGVTRLPSSTLLTLPLPDANLTAITLSPTGENSGIYLLDDNSETVYFLPTDNSFITLHSDQPQPITGNQEVANFIDIMWRHENEKEGIRPGLAMLTQSGLLKTYYPDLGDTQSFPLGSSSAWRAPIAMTAYRDRLYILDNGSAAIWRYLPRNGDFTIERDYQSIVLDDLSDAVDISIDPISGTVLVAYKDGRIRLFDNGRAVWTEETLAEAGLEEPMVAPTAIKIVGSGLNSSIFVSDPGSGRILQLGRNGTILNQFRATDERGNNIFTNISDFAVLQQNPIRILTIAGNTISLTELP